MVRIFLSATTTGVYVTTWCQRLDHFELQDEGQGTVYIDNHSLREHLSLGFLACAVLSLQKW